VASPKPFSLSPSLSRAFLSSLPHGPRRPSSPSSFSPRLYSLFSPRGPRPGPFLPSAGHPARSPFPFSRCRPGPACRHLSPLPLFSPVLNDLRTRRRASPLGPHAEASTPVLKWPRSLHPPVPTCALTLAATEGLQCRRLFLPRSGHLGLTVEPPLCRATDPGKPHRLAWRLPTPSNCAPSLCIPGSSRRDRRR
jgi:hypothetical protein